MSARPYHKRYHSDALAGFMSLTLEERGAYQTLLDLIYDRQGPVLDNERLLAGYMGVSIRRWRTLRSDLIAKRKIHVTEDGCLSNSRAEKELENDAKTSRKLAENGSKGGRARADGEKKINESNGGGQAPLKPGSTISEARSQREAKASSAREKIPAAMPADLVRVMQAARMTRPPSDAALLRDWLRKGADLERHVLPVAKKLGDREAERGRSIGKLKYLEYAVLSAVEEERREIEELREVSERYGPAEGRRVRAAPAG